ncbi:MAG: hypothetical protein Q4G45_10595 [Actinomycetia bacterium]|nr:hypothetical protein [Actinomycetes bacterium]
MARIRLWAVGIGEVRELFGAPEEVAAEKLVSLTPPPVTVARAPGLLGRLGPLLRRAPEAPVVPPDQPTRADAEALLQGHFVAPARLPAAWALLTRWLSEMAWGELGLALDREQVRRVDFDLARAGVSAHYSVRHLWSRDASLPLQAAPGSEVGYLRHQNAVELGQAWDEGLPELEGDSRSTVETVVDWLGQLPGWAEQAGQRPVPDLFAVAQL